MAIDVADGNSAALGVMMLFDFNHGHRQSHASFEEAVTAAPI